MKNIINKLSILLVLSTALVSCDKDQIPYDSLEVDQAYTTAQDFENGIRGVYSSLTNGSIYGSSDAGSIISAGDVLSDNVTISQDGRLSKRDLHRYNYSAANSAMVGLYSGSYQTIYRANTLLYYAEDFEGESKTNIVAEAKALRALSLLNLVSYWGKIPTQSSDALGSLGVAFTTDLDPNQEPPARETVGFIYDQIVQDLTEAREDINESNPVGRLNKNAINLLLSRVYLYLGQWQNAIDAANNVTTSIAPRDQVVNVWQDTYTANTSGLIFYIPNIFTPPHSIGVTWSQGSVNNLIPEYVVSYELYNLFQDNDIRKEAYTISGNTTSGNPVNAIRKLLGKAGTTNGQVDYKILRAEEAYLNKAEALFNLGQEGPARAALDVIRDQRYTSYPGGETGNALRDAIRLERRFEFAFEYQRFLDIKRWGLGVSRSSHGDYANGNGTPSEVLTLDAGSHKFQLPIAQTSMDQNPNLVQNPGY